MFETTSLIIQLSEQHEFCTVNLLLCTIGMYSIRIYRVTYIRVKSHSTWERSDIFELKTKRSLDVLR